MVLRIKVAFLKGNRREAAMLGKPSHLNSSHATNVADFEWRWGPACLLAVLPSFVSQYRGHFLAWCALLLVPLNAC